MLCEMLSECAFSVCLFFIRVVSAGFVVLVALLRVVKECRMVFIYNIYIYHCGHKLTRVSKGWPTMTEQVPPNAPGTNPRIAWDKAKRSKNDDNV